MKSIAVPKRPEITAYLRGTYLMKSTDVPKQPEITAYLRGTYLMKSIAVPNSLKSLHTCGEQITNNLPQYLSSRLTVLISSTYIQHLYTALIYSTYIQHLYTANKFKNCSRIVQEQLLRYPSSRRKTQSSSRPANTAPAFHLCSRDFLADCRPKSWYDKRDRQQSEELKSTQPI